MTANIKRHRYLECVVFCAVKMHERFERNPIFPPARDRCIWQRRSLGPGGSTEEILVLQVVSPNGTKGQHCWQKNPVTRLADAPCNAAQQRYGFDGEAKQSYTRGENF